MHDDGEEDEVFNEEWATSAGMEKKDLNRLELEFLTNIDWNCYVSPKQFEGMTNKLEKSVIQRQISTRRGGWTTYTDIQILSRHIHLQLVWERLANIALQVTAVCLAAYAASLMTMIGTCYALTRANLGPTAVSQSLHTLKSAVTSSSRTIRSPTVQQHITTKPVPNDDADAMPDLSHMGALEQLASEETETSSMAGFITASIHRQRNTCQIDQHQDDALYLVCRLAHHKRKPPYNHHNMIHHPPENHSTDNVLVKEFGSNDTFRKDTGSHHHDNDQPAVIILKDKKLCDSTTSLRKFLSFTMPWKMENFFSFSPSHNYITSCSSVACQNNWENMLNDPVIDTNWFPPNLRQGNALFDEVGKTMIGL